MEFAVIHEIQDRGAWQQALDAGREFPSGLENIVYVEAADRSRAICVWRAPSADALQVALDEHFPGGVVNIVFPIHVHTMPG